MVEETNAMPMFEATNGSLKSVPEASLITGGVKERQDLQQWLRAAPETLGEDLFVVSEEFNNWEDSKRRIDLLALDKDANLVVIEIKRTDDGGHMELQAIRYAAMVSAMSFDDVVHVHEEYLARVDSTKKETARSRILEFLEITGAETAAISTVPRILLVSRDFSKEITTTALWLVEQGLQIRCVQLIPYKLNDRMYLDFRQIIPLATAEEYQVRVRQKVAHAREEAKQITVRERTLSVLVRNGAVQTGTEIEVVPEARPDDAAARPANVFNARVGNPNVRESIIWLHDNNNYSLSNLSTKLSTEQGFKWLASNTFMHWRIVGQAESMWDQAEQIRAQGS